MIGLCVTYLQIFIIALPYIDHSHTIHFKTILVHCKSMRNCSSFNNFTRLHMIIDLALTQLCQSISLAKGYNPKHTMDLSKNSI